MIKTDGIVSALSWVANFLNLSSKKRKKHVEFALDGLRNFIKGKPSKIGNDLVDGLLENAELIGVAPSVTYMKVSGAKDQMNCLWVHPFSMPTLLYKVKGQPVLIMANANLEYNDSVLTKIEHNQYYKDLIKSLKDSRGITG